MTETISVIFSNGIALDNKVIRKACLKALEAIENELPEEARCFEAYDKIITDCKEELKSKKIVL